MAESNPRDMLKSHRRWSANFCGGFAGESLSTSNRKKRERKRER